MSQQPNSSGVSPLLRRMLEDMAIRGLREKTQHDYIHFVRSFAGFLGRSPDTATAEDIRRFQVYQVESGVQPPTIVNAVLVFPKSAEVKFPTLAGVVISR